MSASAFSRAVLIPVCSLGIVAALVGGAAAQSIAVPSPRERGTVRSLADRVVELGALGKGR